MLTKGNSMQVMYVYLIYLFNLNFFIINILLMPNYIFGFQKNFLWGLSKTGISQETTSICKG